MASKSPQQRLFELMESFELSDIATAELIASFFTAKYAAVDEACDVIIEDDDGQRWLTGEQFESFLKWLESAAAISELFLKWPESAGAGGDKKNKN